MNQGKKIEAVNGLITLLPEAIIQHIQSFLTGKEAARTALLSKSWYDAWSTRPNLDFDERDFRLRSNGDPKFQITYESFSEFTKKTMQKYEDLNLKIKTFRLQIARKPKRVRERRWPLPQFSDADDGLVKELIVKALNLGAIELTILGCETLGKLSDTWCKIDPWRNAEVTGSKLKYLYLLQMQVNSLLSDGDFMSKFPCLEELVIQHCKGFNDVRICSRSLKRISLVNNCMETAAFDVPNIRKFHFEEWSCIDIPNIQNFQFETTTHHRREMEWESDIRIRCSQLNASWFISLNKLLEKLSMSKVSLSVRVGLKESDIDTRSSLLNPLPLHVVENLTLSFNDGLSKMLTPAFLDWIFLRCHPKLITLNWFGHGFYNYLRKNYLLELVCKRLVDETSSDDSHCIPNKTMAGLQDLEEVNVEVLVGEWRRLPWKTLLDASACTKHNRIVRFQLRWGLEPSAAK